MELAAARERESLAQGKATAGPTDQGSLALCLLHSVSPGTVSEFAHLPEVPNLFATVSMATGMGGRRREVIDICGLPGLIFFMPRQQFHYVEIITIPWDVLDALLDSDLARGRLVGFHGRATLWGSTAGHLVGCHGRPPCGVPRLATHTFHFRALGSLNLSTWLWGFAT